MADPAPAWAPEGIGQRLLIIRKKRRLGQGALARKVQELGVAIDAPLISKFENGFRRPSLRQMLALARVLEVTPADLGVSAEDYPEVRFLKDPETRAILEATPSYLQGKRTGRRRRPPSGAQQPPIMVAVRGSKAR